jgi:DNA (cytosine-5)-methyltransferase 1
VARRHLADRARVKRLLIENVPEFVEWGPVDANGKPIKSRKGDYFREWLATLTRLGFRHEWRILNCADYGDATTRRRFFLLARSDGKPIEWPEPTHAKDGSPDLFGRREKWRGARECIDWTLRGRSIFGRKIPLAPRTVQRIYAGAVRFGWPSPYLVVLRQHMAHARSSCRCRRSRPAARISGWRCRSWSAPAAAPVSRRR